LKVNPKAKELPQRTPRAQKKEKGRRKKEVGKSNIGDGKTGTRKAT
jgi:hypothetical protein